MGLNSKRGLYHILPEPYGKIVIILGLIFIFLFAYIFHSKDFGFKLIINQTPSLPHSVYIHHDKEGDITYGDLIIFSPSNEKVKGFTFVKRVAGLPGDEIKILDGIYFINNSEIGPAQNYSPTGVKLNSINAGIIPEDSVFVTADHFESFDSRYELIGLIKLSEIQGYVRALF